MFEAAGRTRIPRAVVAFARKSRRELISVGGGGLLVGVTAVGLWLASGVRLGEIARFVPYELGFVFLPGWLVYRALAPPLGRLAEIVFGWTLGYLLEAVAFLTTAALGLRGGFVVYPAVVGIPAAAVAWRRRTARQKDRVARTWSPADFWLGAVLCVVLLLYAASVFFTQMPLPRGITSATYQEDTVFATSLAAEVLHHWPVTLPMVAGQPLHYQLFPFMHMAAITQVTGIDLSVVVMRLYEVPLILLFALQLVLAGRRMGRMPLIGLSAAFLVLFFGELDPSRGGSRFLFDDFFFYWLFYSHTFLFGFVFFLAAVVLVCDLIDPERVARTKWPLWVLVGAYLIGATGSKPYALIEAIGGLVVLVLWQLWRRRTLNRAAAGVLLLCIAIQVAANVLVFKWSAGGEVVRAWQAIEQMPGVTDFSAYLRRVWSTSGAKPVLGVPFGTFGLLAVPIAGIALLWLQRRRLTISQAWFLALFIATAAPFFLLAQPGLGQMFVVFFGVVPGTVLASAGYREFLARCTRRTLVVSVAVIAVTAAAVASVYKLASAQPYVVMQLAVFWLLVIGGVLVSAWRPPLRVAAIAVGLFALVAFVTPLGSLLRHKSNVARGSGSLAVIIALVVIVGAGIVLRRQKATASVLAAAVVGVLVLGILNTPLDWFPSLVSRATAGQSLYDRQYRGLTAGLYDGLLWIRNHTKPSAVLVVNNHSLDPHGGNSKYFYYSAFAQRRVVLESWDYTPQTAARHVFSLDLAHSPFPYRLHLSEAVFETASVPALRTLEQTYGARYLVVDKVHGAPSPALSQRTAPVFTNSDIDVYNVDAALRASAGPVSSSCASQAQAGITAVFARARSLSAAYLQAHQAQAAGFQGLTVQRRGCHAYAVALTGLKDVAQGRALREEAAKVGLRVTIECRSHAPSGGLAAVFGHRRTQIAAEKLRREATRFGFRGLRVQQDRCGDWEVDLYGLDTVSQRQAFTREAAKAGFRIAFEPG